MIQSNIRIADILSQKIADIQGRLPVKMNLPDNLTDPSITTDPSNAGSFSSALDEASLGLNSAAPSIVPSLLNGEDSNYLSPSTGTGTTKYPLVSGSYESVYTRLSQDQIQELMPRINEAIDKYSSQFGLDPKLVRSVIKQESGFQPFALSTSGAMGLMQLMPGTAEGLGVTDPYNIEQNIKGGTQYLYYQMKAFDGNLDLALSAYNAGPNAVKKYGGIPPYAQTQDYVKKVKQYYQMYQALGDN
ncbi:MAG: lytic transglycosylase domain-containing protein [Clostridia bacterium]|nr:lytic transglycosylase domain-containing protein [Clostridia bacterium]